jgi:hypothetical protein
MAKMGKGSTSKRVGTSSTRKPLAAASGFKQTKGDGKSGKKSSGRY